MKNQTKNSAPRRALNTTRTLGAAGLVLLMSAMMLGCSVTSSRVITATHWGAEQTQATKAQRVQAPAAQDDAASADAAQDDAAEGVEPDEDGLAQAEGPTATKSATDVSGGAHSDMTLYIGYTETITAGNMLSSQDDSPMAIESHMRFCNLKEDASLVCNESPELNKLLNPHMH